MLYLAFELSDKTWKLGFTTGEKNRIKNVPAGDLVRFRTELAKTLAKWNLPDNTPVSSVYEAGRDGFWIHHYLSSLGIHNIIVDPASIEINRRKRRNKTDQLDVKALLRQLMRYCSGEKTVWSVCRVPSVEQEDERRGAAGTIFVYKILGAAAEEGMVISELIKLGTDVRSTTRTLAAAVSPGVSPLTGELMFTLPDDEIFIGMGVHGEPGVGRRKVGPINELVAYMVNELLIDGPIPPGKTTIALVNGTGGTTMMELLTVYGEVTKQLADKGIDLVFPMVGSYSTTQEMAGFSISLFTPTPEMLRLWRASHAAPYFPHIDRQGPEK